MSFTKLESKSTERLLRNTVKPQWPSLAEIKTLFEKLVHSPDFDDAKEDKFRILREGLIAAMNLRAFADIFDASPAEALDLVQLDCFVDEDIDRYNNAVKKGFLECMAEFGRQ